MSRFCNQIDILHLIEGAKKAKGLTVIIDVFRAFSLECYLYDMGVKEIRPVGTIEEAFRRREDLTDAVLVGERHGKSYKIGDDLEVLVAKCDIMSGSIDFLTADASFSDVRRFAKKTRHQDDEGSRRKSRKGGGRKKGRRYGKV